MLWKNQWFVLASEEHVIWNIFEKYFWNSDHSVAAAMYLSLYYWFSWLLLNRVTALIEFSTSMSHCQVQWHCENKICSNCDEVQLQQKVLWIPSIKDGVHRRENFVEIIPVFSTFSKIFNNNKKNFIKAILCNFSMRLLKYF